MLLADDVPEPGIPVDHLMANAPEQLQNFYVAPKVCAYLGKGRGHVYGLFYFIDINPIAHPCPFF